MAAITTCRRDTSPALFGSLTTSQHPVLLWYLPRPLTVGFEPTGRKAQWFSRPRRYNRFGTLACSSVFPKRHSNIGLCNHLKGEKGERVVMSHQNYSQYASQKITHRIRLLAHVSVFPECQTAQQSFAIYPQTKTPLQHRPYNLDKVV